MKKFFLASVALMSLAVVQANAALLNGTVGFAGAVNTPITTGSASVTFTNIAPIGNVLTSSGDLTPVGSQTVAANFAQITLANISTWVLTFGTGPGAYTFAASGTQGGLVVGTDNIAISTNLVGTYSKAGFDDTWGTLRISYQTPQPANPDTYSASGSTIPEPSTYAMLGSALLGLGFLRRRKA